MTTLERLRAIVAAKIAANNTTARAVSLNAGLNPSYVGDMLDGRSSPTLENVEKVLNILGARITIGRE